MASKTPAPPADDFSLDDIKLDDFPMEDNALFADLDNEMRAGDAGKGAGDDLDLKLDSDMPALEEPGELKLDDTMDLELNLDDAPAAETGGGGDLDLDLGDSPKADAGSADLDFDLSLDDEPKAEAGGGDLDLDLDVGDSGKDGGDLDLNLDEEPKADAGGADLDLDLDSSALDLNLDEEPKAADGGDLDLAMDEPSEPKFDMDLPDEPSLSLESEPAGEPDAEGMSLSLAEPEMAATPSDDELPPLDAPALDAEPALAVDDDLPPLDRAPPEAPAAETGEASLELDDGISLDTLPAADTVAEAEPAQDFQAAPDVNLDDVDFNLEMPAEQMEEMEPMGAQVELQPAETAPTMEEGFDLPPLAETQGDEETGPAEPFEAMPDVKLNEDELLELNLPQGEPEQPDFSMAPDGGMPGGGEFRLTEPMAMAAGAAAAGMAAGAGMMAGARGMGLGGGMPAGGMAMRAGGGMAAGGRESAVSQDILLSIPHKISVQMGSVSLVGKDIRNLAYGSVVQLNRTVGEPVELMLDGKSIAQGEIVLINGKNLGVRILALNK